MGKVTVTIDGNPISEKTIADIQLERAYHTLSKLKKLLGPEKLIELLAEESKETEARYLAAKRNSRPGHYKKAEVSLFAEGCCFKDWLGVYIADNVYSHPEHFIARPMEGEENTSEVMEVLGEDNTVFHFKMLRNVPPEAVPCQPDPDSTFVLRTVGVTMDGEPLEMYAFHQFKDRENGLEAKVCIVFPEGADDALVEGHKRHLAVEFSRWLSAAVESKQLAKN